MKHFVKSLFRLRPLGLFLGSSLVLLYIYLSDPNGPNIIKLDSPMVFTYIGQLATPILAVWFAYIMRKVLLPYIKLEELYHKLKETSVGSGIGFLGVCLIMYAMLGLFGGQVANAQPVESYIPVQAKEHIVTLRKEQGEYWSTHPFPGSSQASQNTNRVSL